MEFQVAGYRFVFSALDAVSFPAGGLAGNAFRGAFGAILHRDAGAYARIFEPSVRGPSGLADAPRPFVIRARALDGAQIARGASFSIDVHLFDATGALLPHVVTAFRELAREGIGAGRGRAELVSVRALDRAAQPAETVFDNGAFAAGMPAPLALSLDPDPPGADAVTVRFTTATELKAGGEILARPEFAPLIARIRDRVSTLRALYGPGPLDIDFRGMAGRAAAIVLTDSRLEWQTPVRRSSRTGQVHPLGGFTGTARYEGNLAEFLPWLRAAYWTGAGRQTVWGKGEIRVEAAPTCAPVPGAADTAR